MGRLIDADALRKIYCEDCDNLHLCDDVPACDTVSKLKNMPTIEAEPKHGRWLDVQPAPWGQVYETCSVCGVRQANDKVMDNFCGVCGARMDGEENEQTAL